MQLIGAAIAFTLIRFLYPPGVGDASGPSRQLGVTAMPDLESVSVDQQHALRVAATLQKEFGGFFSHETIELFLEPSYDQFADPARVHNFLPLMAERFARQGLRPLAKVEGHGADGTPIVPFLCVHNAGRSQMALGWFNHLAGGVAWSGGSDRARSCPLTCGHSALSLGGRSSRLTA